MTLCNSEALWMTLSTLWSREMAQRWRRCTRSRATSIAYRSRYKLKWQGSRELKDFGRDAQLERHSDQWCKRKKIDSSNAMAPSDARRLAKEFVVMAELETKQL